MGRPSPLGQEGTALSFRDPDNKGRPTVAMVRARDESNRWQAKRFPVTSWKRDGTPVVPGAAREWAMATRKSFIREEAVAFAGTFQDFAKVLAENLEAAGINPGRIVLIKAVGRALAAEGVSDMRSDVFPARVRKWIGGLKAGWTLPPDAPNRRTNPGPLAPATKNAILTMCRQVTGLAVRKRRLAFDPLIELVRFIEPRFIKPVFSVAELRFMASDSARDHAVTARTELEQAIANHGGTRTDAIQAIAKDRNCHWTTLYNRLKREPKADPWWLACMLMLYTGARSDESMHLRWEWFDWKAGIITLRLADDYNSKGDAERLIPIEPELREILNPIAKTTGHILAPEIRAGSSGASPALSSKTGAGSKDYTGALRRFLHRIGIDPGERTAHSLRHCHISLKMARVDTNIDRLRKAVGHEKIETTQGYSQLSQLYQAEVDQWPDRTLWLRRPVAVAQDKHNMKEVIK